MAGFQLSINGRIWMSTEDLADPASEAAATGWWTALTESGGEGAVVKPLSFVATGSRGLLQPAVKCRGASICGSSTGPSTPCPSTSRVCGSGVCRVNDRWPCVSSRWGLERFVQREPLRRVHECVFGVLALESEPVDPRL